MDVRVSAGDFRLDRLAKLPPGIEELDGRLHVDMTIGGTLEAPLPSGSVVFRDGSLRGLDLKEPIRDIALEAHAGDGAILLSDARAVLKGGAVDAVGAAWLRPGEPPAFRVTIALESPEVEVEDAFDARLEGRLTWAGTPRMSVLSGDVLIEELDVTYPVGLIDLLRRKPMPVVIRRTRDPRAAVGLDVEIEVEDEIRVRNSLTDVVLKGGFQVGGTMLEPAIAGGVYADGGTFRYFDNKFDIETLEVVFVDPSRRDPHVHLLGRAAVMDRSEQEYEVTVRFEGFALETLPEFSSDPELTQPDVVSLLTFGDTFGGLTAGSGVATSSRDRFAQLARGAFVSSLFGVAESTLERMLGLDTVSVDETAVMDEGLVGADVTVGKVFADRLKVNYTTAVGEFGDQKVEAALELNRHVSVETRADPEGNHAIGLRLRFQFR
jgi:autotransporter translocation and assembly factor TamB